MVSPIIFQSNGCKPIIYSPTLFKCGTLNALLLPFCLPQFTVSHKSQRGECILSRFQYGFCCIEMKPQYLKFG